MEFNSFGPAVGRLGSDSSRGPQVEAGGAEPPLAPLTLTTAAAIFITVVLKEKFSSRLTDFDEIWQGDTINWPSVSLYSTFPQMFFSSLSRVLGLDQYRWS